MAFFETVQSGGTTEIVRYNVSGTNLPSYIVGTNFVVGDMYVIVLTFDSTLSQSLTGATTITSNVTQQGTTKTGTYLCKATNTTIGITTRGGVFNSCFTLS